MNAPRLQVGKAFALPDPTPGYVVSVDNESDTFQCVSPALRVTVRLDDGRTVSSLLVSGNYDPPITRPPQRDDRVWWQIGTLRLAP